MTGTTARPAVGLPVEGGGGLPDRGIRRLVFLASIGLLQAIWPLTMDLYLPSFPQLQAELGTAPSLVQLTLTSAFMGMAIGQLVTGPISDAVGRMRPLAAGLVVYAIASVGCALAPTIELLIAARFTQGLGAASCAVISIAIVRDSATGTAMVRLLANLAVVSGLFVVLSPALGAALLSYTDWRGLFVTLVGYGAVLIVLAVVVFLRSETNPPERRALRDGATVAGDYRALFGSRGFVGILIGNGLLFAAMMAYMSSSAFIFQNVFGLTPTLYAVIFGGHGALMIAGAQASARLSRRITPRRIVLVGSAGALCSGIALAVSAVALPQLGLAGFLVPLFLFTGCFGVVGPALQATALEPHRLRAGTAASLIGASSMVFAAVVSPIAGAFGLESPVPPVLVMLTLAALSTAVFSVAFRRVSR